MTVVPRYLLHLSAWTLGLTLLFVLTGMSGPGGQGYGIMARLPALLGFALALGSFPSGIAVSRASLQAPGSLLRRLVPLVGVTAAASIVMFAIVGYWGPGALAGATLAGATPAERDNSALVEPAELSMGELRRAGGAAQQQAEADGQGRISDWERVNALAFEHERRLAHSTLPFLLAWVGLFAAYWADRVGHGPLGRAMMWTMGLFIVMSLYLAGENSFELIAMRAGGPVFFAAWFIAFVPAALFGCLGWTTAMDLLGKHERLR